MKVKIQSILGVEYDESVVFLSLQQVSGETDSSDLSDIQAIREACGLPPEADVELEQFEVIWLDPDEWIGEYLKAEGMASGSPAHSLTLEEVETMAAQNDEVGGLSDPKLYEKYRSDISSDHDDAIRAITEEMSSYRSVEDLAQEYAENLDIKTLMRYVDMDKLGNDLLQDFTYIEDDGRIYIFHG